MMKSLAATLAIASFAIAAQPALAEEVATKLDEDWITLSGTIESVLATSFVLDYGDDDITVEMDKFDWAVDKAVLPGERVVVTGLLDRSFYDHRTIEASTVHVLRLNEYLYADPVDEEGDSPIVGGYGHGPAAKVEDGDWLSFTGLVTAVDGDEIIVANPANEYRVDTRPIIPGDLVETTIEVGDRVMVTGEMDDADLFDKREVEADSVIKLSAHRR